MRLIKRVTALIMVLLLSIESFAAVVSDNDGSAFITKAEFDSLKNNFQSQIDQYNTSIDSKIDGAIASYLAGIRTEKLQIIKVATNGFEQTCWQDGLFANVVYKKIQPNALTVSEYRTSAVPTRLRWNDVRLYRSDVAFSLNRILWAHWAGILFKFEGTIASTPKFRPVGFSDAFSSYANRLVVPFLNVTQISDGHFEFNEPTTIFMEDIESNLWFFDYGGWEGNSSFLDTDGIWRVQIGKIGDVRNVAVHNDDPGRAYDVSLEFNQYVNEDPTAYTDISPYKNLRFWAYPKNMRASYQQKDQNRIMGENDGLKTNIASSNATLKSVYSADGIGSDAMAFAWTSETNRDRQLSVWKHLALGEDDDNYPEISGVQPTIVNVGRQYETGVDGSINDWSFCDNINTTVALTAVEAFNVATNATNESWWGGRTIERTNRSVMRKLSGLNMVFNIPTYKRVTLDQIYTDMSTNNGKINMKQGMQLWSDLEQGGTLTITIDYEKYNSASGTVVNPDLIKISMKKTDFASGLDDYYVGTVDDSSSSINIKNTEYNKSNHKIKIVVDATKGSDAWIRISPVNDIDNSDISKRNLDYVKITNITQEISIE